MLNVKPIIDKIERYSVKHDPSTKTINIAGSVTFCGDITINTEVYDMNEENINNEIVINDLKKSVARIIAQKMLDILEIDEEDITKLGIVHNVPLSELVRRCAYISMEDLKAMSGSTSEQAASAMHQLYQTIAAGEVDCMDWKESGDVQ